MPKKIFELTHELNTFYQTVEKATKEDISLIIPYYKTGLIVDEFFLYDMASNLSEEFKNILFSLCKHYICAYITIVHEYEEGKFDNYIDFINTIRDKEGMKNSELKYFQVMEQIHDIVTVLRSPYINTIELNRLNIKELYGFFCNDDNERITKFNRFPYSCWEPRTEELHSIICNFFENNNKILLEDLFIAKAKVYLRLRNYTLAIIHAIIAIEAVVPEFLDKLFKIKGIDKDTIKDFSNKFGLSVRVKGILKLILPRDKHEILTNVGITIKYRNNIMHEGKTNEFFNSHKIDVEALINSCEELINILKKESK